MAEKEAKPKADPVRQQLQSVYETSCKLNKSLEHLVEQVKALETMQSIQKDQLDVQLDRTQRLEHQVQRLVDNQKTYATKGFVARLAANLNAVCPADPDTPEFTVHDFWRQIAPKWQYAHFTVRFVDNMIESLSDIERLKLAEALCQLGNDMIGNACLRVYPAADWPTLVLQLPGTTVNWMEFINRYTAQFNALYNIEHKHYVVYRN